MSSSRRLIGLRGLEHEATTIFQGRKELLARAEGRRISESLNLQHHCSLHRGGKYVRRFVAKLCFMEMWGKK